ncbi:MAG: endonuclease/exonuclease/phosphatase family protein [Phycisphaerales bacterium]
MRLRVMTWNIHACVGTDSRYDPGRIADVIREQQPDVVALQEVDWRSPHHDGLDQFAFLTRELDMTGVEGPNLSDHRGDYGNALLTTLTVRDVNRIDLSVDAREPRGAMDVHLTHEGQHLRVVVTHLGLKHAERIEQVHRIASAIDEGPSADARILLGDLNLWFPSRLALRTLVPDHFHQEHAPRSWPTRFPLLRLDRVLVHPEPDEAHVRTLRTKHTRLASDHLPVVADLQWA